VKVALVHYWLVGMRGGERVLEALCRMFPGADIYTHVLDPAAISPLLASHKIETTFINRLPKAGRWYKSYLPLMPAALEALDLTGYDLIISSEAGPAKGIIPGPNAVHLSYVHSPMRYIWDQYHVYRRNAGPVARLSMLPISHWLRMWDVTSAARVDRFVANSHFVARRIGKYYRRPADVVFPPVAVDLFAPAPANELDDFYLWAGELVSYKRPDVAIDAFVKSGRRLVVIGDGPERRSLERRAEGSRIEFLGKTDFDRLRSHMARCRALVFPGEEDFGIIPVEVQASGRPVIALGSGGVLDSVVDGETGMFFDQPTSDALNDAIERFETSDLAKEGPDKRLANAGRFTEAAFRAGILASLGQEGLELPALAPHPALG
jgi:glycosyltransferase involved in cell wall biosynthesis